MQTALLIYYTNAKTLIFYFLQLICKAVGDLLFKIREASPNQKYSVIQYTGQDANTSDEDGNSDGSGE